MKVTLKKNGNIEVKVGAFAPSTVGTWSYTNVWKTQGRRDKSGNKLVRDLYEAKLNNVGDVIAYSREELVNIVRNNTRK